MPVYQLADILLVALILAVPAFILRFAVKWWLQPKNGENSVIAWYTPRRTLDDDDW